MTDDGTTDDHRDQPLKALRNLGEGPLPPEALEARVVADLRARGLLTSSSGWRRWILAAAVVALIFSSGFIVGTVWLTPSGPGRPAATYALLLLGGVESDPDESVLVEEYRAWAQGLAREGRLTTGEKLAPAAWLLATRNGVETVRDAPAAYRAAPISGFFLITAEDREEALAIARTCPHLRRGGEVVVRPVDPT